MKAQKFTRETIRHIGIPERSLPKFSVGDTIVVALKIKEGDKERIQSFEGDVLSIRRNGISSTFTIRRIGANGVPVERILPLYSPVIESIKFVRSGKVRRAKLYYMRKRIGKAARVEELIMTREQKDAQANRA